MKNDVYIVEFKRYCNGTYSEIHAAVSRNIITGLRIVCKFQFENISLDQMVSPSFFLFLNIFYRIDTKTRIIFITIVHNINSYRNSYAHESLIGIFGFIMKLYVYKFHCFKFHLHHFTRRIYSIENLEIQFGIFLALAYSK